MIKITDIQETQSSNNPIIREMNEMGHEQVVFCQDQETGLKAIIAIPLKKATVVMRNAFESMQEDSP